VAIGLKIVELISSNSKNSQKLKLQVKLDSSEYSMVKDNQLPWFIQEHYQAAKETKKMKTNQSESGVLAGNNPLAITAGATSSSESQALTIRAEENTSKIKFKKDSPYASSLIRIKEPRQIPKPAWHAPWKLMRVISGHLGWVRSIAVDPSNEWFATGAGDRLIKIWDLASGTLKLSLTGHINTVRGLAISARHPYLFSAGEDKMVKCWDLETNKVIRHYHGHLSGVFCLDLHPTLDILVTGGRDSCARVSILGACTS
jgi:pleiotropic regulator 1